MSCGLLPLVLHLLWVLSSACRWAEWLILAWLLVWLLCCTWVCRSSSTYPSLSHSPSSVPSRSGLRVLLVCSLAVPCSLGFRSPEHTTHMPPCSSSSVLVYLSTSLCSRCSWFSCSRAYVHVILVPLALSMLCLLVLVYLCTVLV